MAPKVTILISTLNRRDFLEKTLWHIYETSDDSERDIWIWDNASEDDTPDFLGTIAKWPGVRCFRSEVGVGIMGSKPRMAAAVKTPFIFTMDDDMWQHHRGWVSAVARVLENDPSIHQLSFGGVGDWTCNYGVVHAKEDRPFFRVPTIRPWPTPCLVPDDPVLPEGSCVVDVAGEKVIVPINGPHLPFPYTGGCAGWRTDEIKTLLGSTQEKRAVADLTEVWGHPLAERGGTRAGLLMGYGFYHPSPGPLWHLGHGERYWEDKCRMAPSLYNRTSEEQASWLDVARRESGWGQPLEDPDVALPTRT